MVGETMKSRFLIIFLILAVCACLARTAIASSDGSCNSIFQSIDNGLPDEKIAKFNSVYVKNSQIVSYEIDSQMLRHQDFTRLDPKVRPKDSIGFDLRDIVPSENRVVIGIEKRKHVFMVVGNIRFDGRIFYDTQSTAFSDEIPIGQGIFLALDEVPDIIVKRLMDIVLEPSPEAYFGCGNAVFSKLKQAGIIPGINEGLIIKTSHIFEILTNANFNLPNGQRIQSHLFRTSDINLNDFYLQLSRYDQKVKSDIARNFHGIGPNQLVEMIVGKPKPISEELKAYISDLTGGY